MKFYSKELNIQFLVALLKLHKIKKVIVSPGTTNLSFVASLQCDAFFELYSCVDERSAAYMAIGMAEESGEPVVITCTGATASRNYMSALTEAYYRKLPILAITGTQRIERIGQLNAQVIDRSVTPKDICLKSVTVNPVESTIDAYYCQLFINDAILELKRKGGGPVHINLSTGYNRDFSVEKLPEVRLMQRYSYGDVDNMPILPQGRIGIFVGSHATFSKEQNDAIERFCLSNNAVAFCDHSSGYYGKYKLNYSLVAVQEKYKTELTSLDLCVHIGEVSGDYGTLEGLSIREVWRVSPDGEIRDPFKKLTNVFEMEESDFFRFYSKDGANGDDSYLKACKVIYSELFNSIPEIPFSNVWIAYNTIHKLPAHSVLHLGILNSLRTWNLFELPDSTVSFSNVGGFGIDGCMSSLIGASLINPQKLYFGVFGDLAFFYDINSLGNRHIGKNLRIIVVNNGKGTEFKNFYHTGSLFGKDADKYIAASEHFGNQSKELVKHFSEDLGFTYMSAASKEEFLSNIDLFTNADIDRSIVFEIFTNSEDESVALKTMWNISSNSFGLLKDKIDSIIKLADKTGTLSTFQNIVGKKGVKFIKKLLQK